MRTTFAVIPLAAVALFQFGGRKAIVWAEEDQLAKPPVANRKVHKDRGHASTGRAPRARRLRARLKKHKEASGVVWHYREGADKKAEEQGEVVVKAIIELRLLVRWVEKEGE